MMNHSYSKSPLFLSLATTATLLLSLARDVTAVRTYTDAKGDTFTLPDDKKGKIVSNVMGALSLFHLGMESDQLVAIYDHWMVRGSNIDFDDPTQEYESHFAIDPNKEEVEFLEQQLNLSPTQKCRDNSNGCWSDIDPEKLASVDGEYDFILLFRNPNGGATNLQNDFGRDVIYVDYLYEHNRGCFGDGTDQDQVKNEENCYSMSLIDAVMELEILASFLGIEQTQKVVEEKRAMCEAAADFVEHSKMLHDKGIYANAITLRIFNGVTMSWLSPVAQPWLRTLEELGFPLVHPPMDNSTVEGYWRKSADDWFVNCDTATDCDDVTGLSPVDIWLLDSRTYAQVHSFIDDSIAQFPDKALAKKQYTYWQFNDGAISYTNIARYLNDVILQTLNVERVHDKKLTCLDVDVTSMEFTNKANGGITGMGDPLSMTFACHGNLQSLYLECPAEDDVGILEEVEPEVEEPEEQDATPVIVSGGVRRTVMTTVLALQMAVAWIYAN